ncbi:MAG TPA: hypothetical protein VMV86_05355, partial [Methanosarcinales archaeon]|nr:hypothetical protein [Methanosarcinales archaeon]
INKVGTIAESYKIYGCWLASINELPLSVDSDTPIIVGATLAFDYWTKSGNALLSALSAVGAI